jgi:hypothetical protein
MSFKLRANRRFYVKDKSYQLLALVVRKGWESVNAVCLISWIANDAAILCSAKNRQALIELR